MSCRNSAEDFSQANENVKTEIWTNKRAHLCWSAVSMQTSEERGGQVLWVRTSHSVTHWLRVWCWLLVSGKGNAGPLQKQERKGKCAVLELKGKRKGVFEQDHVCVLGKGAG